MRAPLHRIALLAALLPSLADAQQGTARLGGTVIDAATRQPLAVAEVQLARATDTLRTRTDDAGRWSLPARGEGPWTLRVRRPGYAPHRVIVDRVRDDLVVELSVVALSLDAVVVSAARREQKLKDAVTTVELVTRRDLEASAAPDVAAVLTEQTGIQLEGGTPSGAGIQLQGLGAQRVLILLDGQPLVGRLNGNFDLSRLPTSMIERIEVIKGSQSTLYGSDAMGGVINIVTRRPAEAAFAGTVNVNGGTLGRRDASVDASGRTGRFGWAADAGARGVSLVPGRDFDPATFANRGHMQLRGEYEASRHLTAFASAFTMSEAQRYALGPSFRFADNAQHAARVGVTWQRGAHRLQPLLHVTQFTHLSRASRTGSPVSDSGGRDRQTLAEFELTYSGPSPAGLVDAGVEVRRDGIRADRVPGVQSFDQVEPFAQVTWVRGGLSIVPGVRGTFHRRFGEFVTPRVALLWRPTGPLAVRANWGRGFRAPDFKELFLEFVNTVAGYAVRGNPDLRPESSTNVSAGVEYVGDAWFARTTAFRNTFDDFIQTGEQDLSGTFRYQNISRGRTQGMDVEAGYARGAWRAEAGWSWLDARDTQTGTPLLGRPPQSGRALVGWGNGGWHASATLIHTGRTPISLDPLVGVNGDRLPWTRLDLRAARTLGALTAQVGVDNVLDRQLDASWPGFTGRMIYGGLSWRFGQR